jgi:hypothetical protein
MATASLDDSGVLGAVVGTAGYLTGIALLGLAAGTLLRSTAVAISTLFGVVFLLPGLAGQLLPGSWKDHVLTYLPSNAGAAFTGVHHVAGTLSTGAGIVVFLAWILVPLGVAAVLLKRRSVWPTLPHHCPCAHPALGGGWTSTRRWGARTRSRELAGSRPSPPQRGEPMAVASSQPAQAGCDAQ